jgi:hypothetical protein
MNDDKVAFEEWYGTNAVAAVSDEPAFGASDQWPELDEPHGPCP